MAERVPLRVDTLFLACTRPAMHWGVPMEGFYFNIFGTALFAFIVGRGNPFYWLIFFVLHLPMVALANKNPNFFHEWIMWLDTKGRMVGGILHAIGGKNTPSSV